MMLRWPKSNSIASIVAWTRNYSLLPNKMPKNPQRQQKKPSYVEPRSMFYETIKLATNYKVRESYWGKLFAGRLEDFTSVNRSLKNPISFELYELIKEKSSNMSTIQTARTLRILTDTISSNRKLFKYMWDRIDTIASESQEPFLQSGIHFMIFESILKALPIFKIGEINWHHTLRFLQKLHPFVVHYYEKLSLPKKILASWVYKELSLFDADTYLILINSVNLLKNDITNLSKNLEYYFIDEQTPTDLTIPLLKLINFAYLQSKLSRWLDSKEIKFPDLDPALKNELFKRLYDSEIISNLSTANLLERAEELNFPELFSTKEHQIASEAIFLELCKRDPLENIHLLEFARIFVKFTKYLSSETISRISSKILFKVESHIAELMENNKKYNENNKDLQKAMETAISLMKICIENGTIKEKAGFVIFNALNSLWNNFVKLKAVHQEKNISYFSIY